MALSPKAMTGMHVASKLAEDFLNNTQTSSRIRELRTTDSTLAEIVDTLLRDGLVPSDASISVVTSAVSTAARTLLGPEAADEIAARNRHVLTDDERQDAWRAWQAAGTEAAAKANGRKWEFEDDRILCETVACHTNGHGTQWEDVAWFLWHQHGIDVGAQACRMRFYKITPHSSSRSDLTRNSDNGNEEPITLKIEDFR